MSYWDPPDEWKCCEVSSLKKKKKCIYLLIFGCAGSLLLCGLPSNCSEQGATLCATFSVVVSSLVVEHGL